MLTRSGLGALVVAIFMVGAGILWGYTELLIIGVGLVALIGVSVAAVRLQQPARVERVIPNPRVARGGSLPVEYRVTNPTRRRSPPMSIVDQLAKREARTSVPSLAKRDRMVVQSALPARRRGVHRVGPGWVERNDPFWFALGRRRELHQDQVIVHPRVHPIDGPFGSLHASADEALSRSVASDPLNGFVSMREYIDGDDPRLIHWPTTARTGTLMVREHVELRRPEFGIIIDAAAWVATPHDFEEMVDVAASLAIHALRTGIFVRVATTNHAYIGQGTPLQRDTEVLDFLTPIKQAPAAANADIARVVHITGASGLLACITGPEGPSSQHPQLDELQVIRIGRGAQRAAGIASVAETASHFAEGWR